MGSELTYKGKIEDWNRLEDRLTANAAELAHLEGLRTQLGTVLGQTRQIAAAQAAQKAAKQEASKTLKTAVLEGDRLANLLRTALKQHYGIRSEKLAEFGMQPFRGRNLTAKARQPKTKKSKAAASPTGTAPAVSEPAGE